MYRQWVLNIFNACLLDLPGAVFSMYQRQFDRFEVLALLAYGREMQLTWFTLHSVFIESFAILLMSVVSLSSVWAGLIPSSSVEAPRRRRRLSFLSSLLDFLHLHPMLSWLNGTMFLVCLGFAVDNVCVSIFSFNVYWIFVRPDRGRRHFTSAVQFPEFIEKMSIKKGV